RRELLLPAGTGDDEGARLEPSGDRGHAAFFFGACIDACQTICLPALFGVLLIAGSEQRYAVPHVALHRSRVAFILNDDIVRTDRQAVDTDVEVPLARECRDRGERSGHQQHCNQNVVQRDVAQRNDDGPEDRRAHAGCSGARATNSRTLSDILTRPDATGLSTGEPHANSLLDAGSGSTRSRARRRDRAPTRRPAAQSRPHALVVGTVGAELERFPAHLTARTLALAQ